VRYENDTITQCFISWGGASLFLLGCQNDGEKATSKVVKLDNNSNMFTTGVYNLRNKYSASVNFNDSSSSKSGGHKARCLTTVKNQLFDIRLTAN